MATPEEELRELKAAVARHYAQKADDRCWMDDDELYQAAGLPTADTQVGDKEAMLANCRRFIDRRCTGGHWPSYRELEEEIARLKSEQPQAPYAGFDPARGAMFALDVLALSGWCDVRVEFKRGGWEAVAVHYNQTGGGVDDVKKVTRVTDPTMAGAILKLGDEIKKGS